MTDPWLDAVIDDVEEELAAFGSVCLYNFTWSQDIGKWPDEVDTILAVAHEAYAEIRRRHPNAWLGWVTWPHIGPESARPAKPDTELDFILDHRDPTPKPLLVLVDTTD